MSDAPTAMSDVTRDERVRNQQQLLPEGAPAGTAPAPQ